MVSEALATIEYYFELLRSLWSIVAEGDVDHLVLPSLGFLCEVSENLIISGGGIVVPQASGPKPARQHRIELSAIHGELGQQEEEADQSDDGSELPIGRGTVAQLVVYEA